LFHSCPLGFPVFPDWREIVEALFWLPCRGDRAIRPFDQVASASSGVGGVVQDLGDLQMRDVIGNGILGYELNSVRRARVYRPVRSLEKVGASLVPSDYFKGSRVARGHFRRAKFILKHHEGPIRYTLTTTSTLSLRRSN
jgi:hypothetical protein